MAKNYIMQPREDNEVELVFQKSCNCKIAPDYVIWHPATIVENGTPHCPKCGGGYEYKFVQVKSNKR